MRTYEQCREEMLDKFNKGLIQGPVTFGKIEDMSAKEYAKQWVEKAIKEAQPLRFGSDVPALVDSYLNQIDKH